MLTLALWGLTSLMLVAHTDSEGEAASPPRDVTQQTCTQPEALDQLEQPGTVFFEEDFESLENLDRWYNRIGGERDATQVVLDKSKACSGTGSLQLHTVANRGHSSAAGASYWFHPGYETVYFRRYIRFAEDYDQGNLNHVGGSLYAVAGGDRWAEMGKAGVRPQGDDRFGAGFEPWRAWRQNPAPGAMMLYTYWMDMQRDRDGHYWGSMFAPPKTQQVLLQRGVWHCLEHMIRANTPGKSDGEMAAWVDGKLYIHLKGFRWRRSPDVRLKRISLGLYVHQSHQPNTVWYDDVVLSTGYIGPDQ